MSIFSPRDSVGARGGERRPNPSAASPCGGERKENGVDERFGATGEALGGGRGLFAVALHRYLFQAYVQDPLLKN
jgi:hypothetical protein